MLCGEFGAGDFLLNIVLFVPLGIGLALAGVRASRAIPAICAATLLIEALQVVVITGRDATFGDVIANSLGGIVGFGIGARSDDLLRPPGRSALGLTVIALTLWVCVQTAASYTLRLALPKSVYCGEIMRPAPGDPPYPGRILSATLDGEPVPDTVFSDSERIRALLSREHGAVAEATVVPHGLAATLSPLVLVEDLAATEILLLAADRTDLVFSVRTVAAALRFRRLRFLLRGAFPGDAARATLFEKDTVRIHARYSFPRVVMAAAAGTQRREMALELTPAAAWRLVLPADSYVDGSGLSKTINATWLFLLLAPAGYWAAIAWRGGGGRGAFVIVSIFIGLAAGFAVAPLVFHLALPDWSEVVGGAGGLLAAGLVASVFSRRRFDADR